MQVLRSESFESGIDIAFDAATRYEAMSSCTGQANGQLPRIDPGVRHVSTWRTWFIRIISSMHSLPLPQLYFNVGGSGNLNSF